MTSSAPDPPLLEPVLAFRRLAATRAGVVGAATVNPTVSGGTTT